MHFVKLSPELFCTFCIELDETASINAETATQQLPSAKVANSPLSAVGSYSLNPYTYRDHPRNIHVLFARLNSGRGFYTKSTTSCSVSYDKVSDIYVTSQPKC